MELQEREKQLAGSAACTSASKSSIKAANKGKRRHLMMRTQVHLKEGKHLVRVWAEQLPQQAGQQLVAGTGQPDDWWCV